ncbi:MAG: ABC transporter ATP-binding protein, partial [Planctomycetota bacterium]
MPDFNTAKTNKMNNPILSVRDIYFAYPRNNKEDVFSIEVDKLDIYSGERLALIGPNGAGKTTLLQLIALLQPARSDGRSGGRPNKGTISFNNSAVKTDSQILAYHRATAFVPQKAILYNCSVKDNVALGLKIRSDAFSRCSSESRPPSGGYGASRIGASGRNVSASEINDKTAEILKTFRIEHLANRSALRISGGESRRVMLARALVLNPKILFLDEPFGDLDEPVRIELMNDLLPVLSRAGCATVFVTHNQDETYQLADRFMIMLKGRIVQSGTGQEIFGNPANQEIAQFIGIKNILSAQVISVEKDIIHVSLTNQNKSSPCVQGLDKSGPQLYISGAQPKTENVVICIPPESIIIVADPPDQMTSRAGQNQAMHSPMESEDSYGVLRTSSRNNI